MRRGELWTVTPLAHPKPRPAVILSVDAWNAYAPDVILVPLTTRPGPSRPPVTHPRLEHKSYAKCGALAALPKERLKQRLGRLDARTMATIAIEVRRLLGACAALPLAVDGMDSSPYAAWFWTQNLSNPGA